MGLGVVVGFLRARRPSLWYLFSIVFLSFFLSFLGRADDGVE